MSIHVSQQCAKLVRDYIGGDSTMIKSLDDLGLVNAKISVIHEKGTDNSQVNICFDLKDGDNIEGIARKFGMGLLPSFMQKILNSGMVEKPKSEFFCIPQSGAHDKDAVVAVFSFHENMRHTTDVIRQRQN